MNCKYFTYVNNEGREIIVRLEECVPWHFQADEASGNYQQYLAWLAEGNTPEPWEAQDASN